MTRDEDVRAAAAVPYRLLEAVPELDGGNQDSANMLIQGDNLDALKALLPYFKGAVKCIYIDPPYNTRSAFAHQPHDVGEGPAHLAGPGHRIIGIPHHGVG